MNNQAQTFDIKNPDSLVALGGKLFASSKSARSLIEERWVRSNQLYDSEHPKDTKKTSDILKGQYRLFIPKTYNTVQRMMSEVMETFFFDDEEIVDFTSGADIPTVNRETIKIVANHRLTGHPINFYEETTEFVQDGLKNKVGIFKVYPKLEISRKEKGRKKVKDAAGKETEMVDYETKVTKYSPRIDCVCPEDLFLDAAATWKDYFNHTMIHRYVRTRAYLKQCGFKNVDEAPGLQDLDMGDAVKTQRARSGYSSPFYQTIGKGEGDKVMVYEVWTHMPMGDSQYLPSVTFSLLGGVNGPTVLGLAARKNTLPYQFDDFEPVRPPFVIGTPFPEAHKAYGKDVPEFTDGLQTETNLIRNQEREAAALSLRKPLLVSKEAQIDMQALLNRKIGGVVVGEDVSPEMVRELQTSNPSFNTEPVQRKIDNDYYEATSLYPGQFGASTKDESATGASITNANANKKLDSIIRNFAHTGLIPALRLFIRLEQAYETDEYIQMVTGRKLGWGASNDGKPDWRMIQGEFGIKVQMGTNKQQQLNRYLLIADRMNQSNAALGQLVQAGVVDPQQVQFGNPMWAFDEMLKVMKHKNVKETKLQALKPPPQEGAGAEPKGLASQPKQPSNPQMEVVNSNPEEFLNGLL